MRRRQKIIWLFMLGVAVVVAAFLYTYKQKAPPARTMDVFTVEEPKSRKPFKKPNADFIHKDITLILETNAHRRDTKVVSYYLLEPLKPYPDGFKFPLVIVLHDFDGNALAAENLGLDRNRLKYPAFILVPQLGSVSNWYYPDQPASQRHSLIQNAIRIARPMGPELEGLLDNVRQNYPIDPQRIYVIGCQMGGVGALGLARARPDLIAAAFSINGGWAAEDAKDFIHTPLWLAHAPGDPIFGATFSQDFADAVRKLGGTVQYNSFGGTPKACQTDKSYPDAIWQWLFRQHKAAVPSAP